MEIQRDCEYAYEEMKKCYLCNLFIEGKFHRLKVCNRQSYYHPCCFNLMIQRMERLGMMYDC